MNKHDPQPAPERPDPARRGFLKAAPLGALALVAAAPATATATGEAAAVAAPDPKAKRGYHETEHIRRYYASAAYW